mmetsp:Transcript_60699/g.140170  ORF Transcript_60699/g.140170 Transcript_60699/m.140170 type:complete len:226 (-) Transcript_60699:1944-2621(-)
MLHPGVASPEVHRGHHHPCGSGSQDRSSVVLLHSQVAECAQTVSLDSCMPSVGLQGLQASLNSSTLGDVLPVFLVQGQIGNSCATSLAHFRVIAMVLDCHHHQPDAPSTSDFRPHYLLFSHICKSLTRLALDACLRNVTCERFTDHSDSAVFSDLLVKLMLPAQNRHHLTTPLLQLHIIRECTHRVDDNLEQISLEGESGWIRPLAKIADGLETEVNAARILTVD